MEARTVGSAINMLGMTGYAIVATWRGYGRRRAHWTRGSWLGLGVTVLVGLSLLALMLVISAAVDNHEPWVGAPRSDARSGWVLVSLGSMVGGVFLVVGSLGWFAVGPRTKQFFLFGRSPAEASPRESWR